jgi:hypothetical protein
VTETTTMAAIAAISTLVACRPTRHRSFDEFYVLWFRTLRPGRETRRARSLTQSKLRP